MQTPGGTSRTRSGKLLPLSSSVRTVQGIFTFLVKILVYFDIRLNINNNKNY